MNLKDKRRRKSACLAIILGLLVAEPLHAASEDLTPYLSTREVAFFRETFDYIAEKAQVGMDVSVNLDDRADLHVYIVNVTRAQFDGVEKLDGVLVDDIDNNFVVRGDGTAFLDQDFLQLVGRNALVDVLGFKQARGVLPSGNPGWTMSDYSNMSALFRIAVIREVLEFKDIFNEGLIEAWMDADRDGTKRIIAFAFAPILLHEFGHLRDGTSGQFLGRLLRDYISDQFLEDEEAADAFAIEALERMFASFFGRGDFNEEEYLTLSQAAVSTLKLLVDLAFYDAFEGFRGLPAEASATLPLFHDCLQRPELRGLPLAAPGRIEKFVGGKRLSFLSQSEFETMRDNFLSSSRSGTHPHYALRVRAFAERLSQWLPGIDEQFADGELLLLDAFVANDPSLISVGNDNLPSSSIDWPLEDFVSIFEADFEFKEVVTCTNTDFECLLAIGARPELGVLEATALNDRLTFVSYTVPIQTSQGTEAEKNEFRRNALRALFRYLAVTQGYPPNLELAELEAAIVSETVLIEFLRFLQQLDACAVGHREGTLYGLNYFFSTLDDGKWIQVTIATGE